MAKKRYDEGGVTEGENQNIGDDTRARALKWVQEQEEKGSEDESSGEKTVSRSTKAKASSKPAERKGASVDDEAGRSRGRPAEGAPKTTTTPRMAKDSRGIPTRELKAGETQADYDKAAERRRKEPVGPNSASGSELGRNVKNTLAAMGPTRLAGLGNAAAEAGMGARAAKAAETARAAREAKTLNPNAWLAGPKGMKENFKKGGSVKGWGSARGARKAKIY